jgi:hypothetical protein
MKYLLCLLVVPFLTGSTCNKLNQSTPACILDKIELIKAQPKWNPPAEVNEYLYNDQHVYLFSSNCCDQYNVVYDENCNPVCAPSGGFAGKGDGKCTDFNERARHIRLVWKDNR